MVTRRARKGQGFSLAGKPGPLEYLDVIIGLPQFQEEFKGDTEKFVNDPEADAMLTRKEYRKPYIVPDKI